MIGFCLNLRIGLNAQNQQISDSVRQLVTPALNDSIKSILLRKIIENEQNRDTTIKYAFQYLDLSEKHSDEDKIYFAYTKIGGAYKEKGDFEQALKYMLRCLDHTEDAHRIGTVYSNIGTIYSGNENYSEALKNYRLAAKIFIELPDSLRLGTTYISLGYTFYKDVIADSAIMFLEDAKTIFESIDIRYSDYYLAYAQGNLALAYGLNEEINKAELLFNKAILVLEKYKDDYAICDYEIQMASLFHKFGNKEEALILAESALNLARNKGYKEFIQSGSEILSEFYRDKGNFEKAYKYQSDFMTYKDSLVNADLIRELANQRTQFEVGQKQVEVDLLTAEKRIQRIILFATAAFALIFIVLASIIYRYYRSKNKINRILARQKIELEDLNETKDKFFSIISHDIRGPVASFQGIGHLIKFFVESKETNQLLEVADHIDQSVDQLSKLLDNLLAWAMQQQGSFPNVPEKLDLNEISNDLVKTLGNMAESKKITLTSTISESIHLWADKNSTMTILRNLVNNSLKFTPEGGSVTIAAKQIEGMAEISVSDTGVGIPKEKLDKLFKLQDKKSTYGTSGEKGLGLGLQLVYEFMEMNNGSIEVESEEGKGTTFIIRLPLFESEHVTVKA
jgi:signal transduction histidine kinase